MLILGLTHTWETLERNVSTVQFPMKRNKLNFCSNLEQEKKYSNSLRILDYGLRVTP